MRGPLGLFILFSGLAWGQPPDSQFFDAKGVKIHYLIRGSGTPVILIHGLDSTARANWELPGTLALLAKEHQVVALDLPGYGQSDKPPYAAAYGQAWVEDIGLLLDHLHLSKAHIVGYSTGGMVALKFISDHPDRALSSVLGGMGWLQDSGALQTMWARMKDPGSRGASELALTKEALEAIRIPVEVLVGSSDPVRHPYITPLRAARTDWPVIEIQGAGHLSCIAKDQFKQELVKWINSP